MDSVDLSLFTQEFANENGLDFSTLLSSSMFTPIQEPNPIPRSEIDGRQQICETSMKRDNDEPNNKRLKHKEIEKQRRQETTSLLRNLRNLLPSQYLSRTRSSSDHVREAVIYIKDLQKKIKEASEKRDRIKRSISHPSSIGESSIRSLPSSSLLPSQTCSCVGDTHIAVVVRSCLKGLEIVVSCCVRHKSCLSIVLQLLAQEQCLDVVSCISNGQSQRFMHTIVSEVEEGIKVNLPELQKGIIKMIKSYYIKGEYAH